MVRHSLRSGSSEEPEMRRSSRIGAVAVVEVEVKRNDRKERRIKRATKDSEVSTNDEYEEYARALPKRGSKGGNRKQKQPETRRSGRISATVNYCENDSKGDDIEDSSDNVDDNPSRKLPSRKAKEKISPKRSSTVNVKKHTAGNRRSTRLSGLEAIDTTAASELEPRKQKSKILKEIAKPKAESESEKDVGDGSLGDEKTGSVVPEGAAQVPVRRGRRSKEVIPDSESKPETDMSHTLSTDVDKSEVTEGTPDATATQSEVQDNSISKTDTGISTMSDLSSSAIANTGKLRSSMAETEGLQLARNYRKSLRDMEEYSLNFITQEVNQPVISCFRELSKSDISTILGSAKLKKSLNRLELSYLYLGLIDLLATANNNPFYGETHNAKFSRNLSSSVQRVLLEFKNIIGTWAISGNDVFSNRASLIIRYLRSISPMFAKAGFEGEFSSILDSIEMEISRVKLNHEKLKQIGVPSPSTSTKTTESNPITLDDDDRGALNEIVLNLNLVPKPDLSDEEEDVTVIDDEKAFQIFGKPLKASPNPSNQRKKTSQKNSSSSKLRPSGSSSSSASKNDQNGEPGTSKSGGLNFKAIAGSVKRAANEELTKSDTSKRPKLLESVGSSPVSRKETTSIRNFFQSALSSVSTSSGSASSSQSKPKVPKPAVNAFALMMNKSKEIALKKKAEKLGAPVVPTLNMKAVKSS